MTVPSYIINDVYNAILEKILLKHIVITQNVLDKAVTSANKDISRSNLKKLANKIIKGLREDQPTWFISKGRTYQFSERKDDGAFLSHDEISERLKYFQDNRQKILAVIFSLDSNDLNYLSNKPQRSTQNLPYLDLIKKIETRIKMMAKGYGRPLLIITGLAGVGKSELVKRTLTDLGLFNDTTILKGSVTEAYFFDWLKANPKSIAVFDDCPTVISLSKESEGLRYKVLEATNSQLVRRISHNRITSTDTVTEFTGSIIIIANKPLIDWDNSGTLASRAADFFHLTPSSTELLRYALEFAKKFKLNDQNNQNIYEEILLDVISDAEQAINTNNVNPKFELRAGYEIIEYLRYGAETLEIREVRQEIQKIIKG